MERLLRLSGEAHLGLLAKWLVGLWRLNKDKLFREGCVTSAACQASQVVMVTIA
jgi:hypothetical protein